MKKLVVANWKMNKTREEALQFREVLSGRAAAVGDVEQVIAPPFPFLILRPDLEFAPEIFVTHLQPKPVCLMLQDCALHQNLSGALCHIGQ